MNFLPSLYVESEPADIIISADNGTFVGRYNRQKYKPELAAEEQPIWYIRFIATPDEATTQTLYPNGSKQYCHVWAKREEYNYKYSL